MNVLLIQPPDAAPLVRPRRLRGPFSIPLSPPWDLLCLQTYLSQRSGHIASLVDARFFSSLETELPAALRSFPAPGLVIVNTATAEIGQVLGLLDIIKRAFPALPAGLCGQHPSQFPESAMALPRVDYVLAGDPEPILHSLLDCFTVETRRQRIPGLLMKGSEPKQAHWLKDLNSLNLPDWQSVFLAAYTGPPGLGGCMVRARLSRGHTHCPADRAFGGGREPFRLWRMDRFASCMQRASDKGIGEIFLADPPGFWTPARLDQWCQVLAEVRNAVPWGLQMLPTLLSEDAINQMRLLLCRRVVFLLPSCDRSNLRKYGCILDARELARMFEALRRAGIHPHAEVWMGGPEEPAGERHRVVRMLRALGFPSFSLHPFPYELDAPICKEIEEEGPDPLEAWNRWALDPWNLPRPQAFWGGPEKTMALDADIQAAIRTVEGHPVRLLKQGWQALRAGQVFRALTQSARLRT